MHDSNNDDKENKSKILHPSRTVPAYLLRTSKAAKAHDGFYDVTPGLVSIGRENKHPLPINTK
jgi:hypothetical protein